MFVANRVQQIRDVSEPYQWNYVSSSDNPADITSRGASADKLVNNCRWFSGPEFLWTTNPFKNCDVTHPDIPDDDPEVKQCQTLKTQTTSYDSSLLDYLNRFADWNHLKHVIARCLRFITCTQNRTKTKASSLPGGKDSFSQNELSVSELHHAENKIISLLQKTFFKEEIETLQADECKNSHIPGSKKNQLKFNSPINCLDPFLDDSGVLGGRVH